MAIDRSNIPSNKVYEKHSPGVLLTAILGFAIVGLLALTFVMPIVAYFPNGEERVDLNALNLVFYSLRYFIDGGYNTNFDRFASNVSGYSGQITIFQFLAENQMMAELIISGLLAISVIFAAVVLLYSLAFLLRGHMKSTLMISAISHSVASFYSFFLGLLFLYFFVCNKMFKETNIFESVRFYIAPFFIMIAMIVIAFILSGIYNLCFRRRVYIKNYKPRTTEDPSLKDTPVYKYVSNSPNGTNEVMDNAFNGEQEIEEASDGKEIIR